MKKLTVAVLLLLVCCMSAFAEADAHEDTFTFRNGVQWGVSIDDIFDAEGIDAPVYDYNPLVIVSYEDASVSNYTAVALCYNFIEGRLVCTYYAFEPMEEKDRAYLTGALTAKYGEPVDNDIERLESLIYALELTDDASGFELIHNWHMPDGTYIAAFMNEDAFMIIYFDELNICTMRGIYNTSGL